MCRSTKKVVYKKKLQRAGTILEILVAFKESHLLGSLGLLGLGRLLGRLGLLGLGLLGSLGLLGGLGLLGRRGDLQYEECACEPTYAKGVRTCCVTGLETSSLTDGRGCVGMRRKMYVRQRA